MTRYYHYYRPGKPGWSRRWANVRLALTVIAEFVVLVGLFLGVPALIWLMAPAGGYPR